MFRKYMLILKELSDNRNLKQQIKKGEQMLSEINYEKLVKETLQNMNK